jgi:hypothetical protein
MNIDLVAPFFDVKDVLSTERLTGGRNNYAIKVETVKGVYVLKRYLNEIDRNERFDREVSFLQHCQKVGVKNVPILLNQDRKSHSILQQYVEGLRPESLTPFHFNSASKFIEEINQNVTEDIESLPRAADSLESGSAVIENLYTRFSSIGDARIVSALQPDTYTDFSKAFSELVSAGSPTNSALIENLNELSRISSRVFLSPSDFGFHNCIESKDGLIFIDFEYSGIDNPLKLILDFIYQPDFHVTGEYAHLFSDEIGNPYGLNYVDIPREVRLAFALKCFLMVVKRVFDLPQTKVDPSHAEHYFATRIKPLI